MHVLDQVIAGAVDCRSLLARWAEENPAKPFVVFPAEDSFITYAQAWTGANAFAGSLQARGLRPGERVGIVLPNSGSYLLSWLGCLLGGYVDVAVNPDLSGNPLEYALTKAGSRTVATTATGVRRLVELDALWAGEPDSRRPTVIICPGADGEATRVEPAVRASAEARGWDLLFLAELTRPPLAGPPKAGAAPGATLSRFASIRYTSGTSGLPKGVMMSEGHMLASAAQFCKMTGLQREDTLYSCFPVYHVFSSVTGILSALAVGATLVLAERFSASRFWEHLRRYEATVSHILDPLIPILMSTPPSPADREHSVRCMLTVAFDHDDFEARYGVKLIRQFDMSELTVAVCYADDTPPVPGSCGTESGLFDVRIFDEEDRPVPDGAEGQIVVRPRAPNLMMLGYYGDNDLTVERWRNLWFHTQDRGKKDSNGFFYFLGRMGDRIRRRGENVSPEEIEQVLASHDAVLDCSVIAVPSEVGEDDIKACVLLTEGAQASEEDLLRFLETRLPPYLVPRYLELRASLPRTETQKVQRAALRKEGDRGITEASWDRSTGAYARPGEPRPTPAVTLR